MLGSEIVADRCDLRCLGEIVCIDDGDDDDDGDNDGNMETVEMMIEMVEYSVDDGDNDGDNESDDDGDDYPDDDEDRESQSLANTHYAYFFVKFRISRIDEMAQVVFPSGYFLFNVLYWWLYFQLAS